MSYSPNHWIPNGHYEKLQQQLRFWQNVAKDMEADLVKARAERDAAMAEVDRLNHEIVLLEKGWR